MTQSGARDTQRVEPTPRWIGAAIVLLAVAAVAGVALWIFGSAGAGDGAPITVLRPAEGAEVSDPVEVIFATEAPLRLTPRGWMAGDLHLHASFGGLELMPGAADIEAVGTGRFRWLLPARDPGPDTLRLYWSDQSHRPVVEGGSPAVPVEVKAPASPE